jgi:hypothetical protein
MKVIGKVRELSIKADGIADNKIKRVYNDLVNFTLPGYEVA